MPRFAMRVRTSWPPDRAYAYMADITNFEDWDPGTKSVEQTRGDGPGPGAEYRLKTGGATLDYTVSAYDPPARVQIRGKSAVVTSVDTISVTPDGDGAVVTYDADLTPNGPFKVAGPVFKIVFDRLGEKSAKGLVAKLPHGERLS